MPRNASRRNEPPKMQTSIATLTLQGLGPYSQSREHDEPFLEGEAHDAYERRTWRSKLTTGVRDGKPTVVVPAHALHQSWFAGARYSKRQIPGQGKATWTQKFESGIALLEDPALNIDPEAVKPIAVSCNPQGIRGGRGRVMRYFPVIETGWLLTTDVLILDPIITQEVFTEITNIAGLYIGIGRFRPENGGTNGRYRIKEVVWQDNRQFVDAAE